MCACDGGWGWWVTGGHLSDWWGCHQGLSLWHHPSQMFHCVATAATPEGSAVNCGNLHPQPTLPHPNLQIAPAPHSSSQRQRDQKKTDVRQRHRGSLVVSAASDSGWDLEGKRRVANLGRAFRPRCPPWWGNETFGLSLSRARQQMLLLLLLFWDLMDSSERPTCWQQGGVCKDSQWREEEYWGDGVHWSPICLASPWKDQRWRWLQVNGNWLRRHGRCCHRRSSLMDVETPPASSRDTSGFLMDWCSVGAQVFVGTGPLVVGGKIW